MVKGVITVITILLASMFLSSCSSTKFIGTEHANERQVQVGEKTIPSGKFMGEVDVKPIDLEGELFHSIADWYNQNNILYIVNNANQKGSKIIRYHIYTGEKEVFYETPHQIISLEGSENGTYFAIHTSISNLEANIVIVDKQGSKLMSSTLQSTELQYIWNPFSEGKLFITSFQEDWSFQNYLIDIERLVTEKSEIDQPFIQWMNESSVAYLKWENEQSGNTAPLYVYDLEEKTEKLVKESIVGFHTYKELLVTITPLEQYSLYEFIDPKTMEPIQSLQLPNITTYSDRWWVPNFDHNSKTESFVYYKPIMRETDVEALQLMSYSLPTGQEAILLEGVDDLPVLLSPDGSIGLIGYQHEEILNLETNELKFLIQ
ncbi:YqgU-like beta propeller domain-containing protein [Bacillus sp. AK128]